MVLYVKATERAHISRTRESKSTLSHDGLDLSFREGAFMETVKMRGKVARVGKASVFYTQGANPG